MSFSTAKSVLVTVLVLVSDSVFVLVCSLIFTLVSNHHLNPNLNVAISVEFHSVYQLLSCI